MEFILPFFAGVIVGWLIKWVFDSRKTPPAPVETVRVSGKTGELAAAQHRIKELEQRLGDAQQPGAQVVFREKDRLEMIHGIGPVFASRLTEAGIATFSELSRTSAERVREVIAPEEWQAIDPAAWIAEAQELAAKQRAGQGM